MENFLTVFMQNLVMLKYTDCVIWFVSCCILTKRITVINCSNVASEWHNDSILSNRTLLTREHYSLHLYLTYQK